MLWLSIPVCCLGPLLMLRPVESVREAERTVLRFVEAGWAPSPEMRALAVDEARRLQRWRYLGMSAGALLGSLLALTVFAGLTPAGSSRASWAVWVGFALGGQVATVVAHVRAGRVVTGRRLAGTHPRRVGDYLPPEDRTAARLHLGALGTALALLASLWPVTGQRPGIGPVAVMTAGFVASALVLAALRLVARAPLRASSTAELSLRDVWRSAVLRDLAHLLGLGSFAGVSGLLILGWDGLGRPWLWPLTLVLVAVVVLAVVLPLFGRPVIPDARPGATQEGTC